MADDTMFQERPDRRKSEPPAASTPTEPPAVGNPANPRRTADEIAAEAQAVFRQGLAERIGLLDEKELRRISSALAASQEELRRLADDFAAGRTIKGGIKTIGDACAKAAQSVADLKGIIHAAKLDEFLDSQQRAGAIRRLDITMNDIPPRDVERLGFASLPPVARREFERLFTACMNERGNSLGDILGQSYAQLQAIVKFLGPPGQHERSATLSRIMLGLGLLEAADAAAKDFEEYAKDQNLWKSVVASLLFAGAFALVHIGVEAREMGILDWLRGKLQGGRGPKRG